MEALLLNGTVGAGKTTTAQALSAALSARGVVHAVIDVDHVRLLRPAPSGDPFQHAVAVENLRDLAANCRRAGARRLVIAGVLEQEEQVADYRRALGDGLRHVLLTVRPDVAARRLLARHADDPEGRAWHLARTDGLAAVLAALPATDLVIDTSDLQPAATVERVLRAVGW